MKTKLDAQKTKSLLKKREYEHLLPKLLDIQQQITHQAAVRRKLLASCKIFLISTCVFPKRKKKLVVQL